jgi:hypothetical protein
MKEVQVPVVLPKGWRATEDSRGVVIDAFDADGRSQGSVTVSEKVRGFALGVQGVRRPEGASKYVGRGWKAQLYADAVEALQAVVVRRAVLQSSI